VGPSGTSLPIRVLELPERRAIWRRYWGARRALEDSRQAFEEFPNDVTAEQVRWAEIAVEDAIALAGEFEIPNLSWTLS
jgi:hypothetical protein